MKCGIMTYSGIPNFGAVLQGVALCKTIRNMGHSCELIRYECKNIVNRELLFHKSRNPIKTALSRILIWPHVEKKIKECRRFEEGYVSKEIYSKQTIRESNTLYDCFIAGSDMIWNPEINGFDRSFLLDFTNNEKRRFSYGSSIGVKLKRQWEKQFKQNLRRFVAISVREPDTQERIRKMGFPCEYVADPTMLLNFREWQKEIRSVPESGYVLAYFPYPSILESARRYARISKKRLIVLRTGMISRIENKTIYSPEEWLSYVYGADAVFTDSYHGLLFSLYFHKPCWTNNQGNRVQTLLEEFGLQKCYIDNDPEFQNSIPFDKCEEQMQAFRIKSMMFLKGALNK